MKFSITQILLLIVIICAGIIILRESESGQVTTGPNNVKKEVITTEEARKVYDNMNNEVSTFAIFDVWKAHVKDGKVRINKFEKTNGKSGAGAYIFEYAAEAEVLEAIRNASPYSMSPTYEKGEIIHDRGSLYFEMTERGWRGEDGSVIEVSG